MRRILSAPVFAAVLGISVYGVALAAQEPASSTGEVHAHDAMDHGAAHAPPAGGSVHYLTVNVAVSDAGFEPATIFVPAGQPVQLMLRSRGTAEHHYRVVGLAPDELWWIARDGTAGADPLQVVGADLQVGPASDNHDHHDLQFLRTRGTSPGGITPTGEEVHGYVSAARVVDIVLFTATQTGTFVVTCDLHPEKSGRLTVFEPPTDTAAPLSAASGPPAGPALRAALTKKLGRVDYPEASGVYLEATYDPEDEQHVAVVVTEQLHTANLPRTTPAPELFLSGTRLPLVDSRVVTDSVHHRATAYRFARDEAFGSGHQVMTLRVASGQEATWHLPLLLPDAANAGIAPVGFGDQWALILALLGGMVAAMWPCLFQLTVYFIPALAGVAMQETGGSESRKRRQVLQAAFFFILGFTVLYTATGALIGLVAQQLGDTAQFETYQRYFGVGAGVIVIGLALRVAAKVRAPLVCRMPVLSGMARSNKPATRTEMMLAGIAFATGCMTCFGSALVVGMVVYVGLAQSAFYGALVLFLFSLGMGVPLVLAAMAMARALPLLMKLETAVPWMGLFSALLMGGFGILLISGNYMVVSEWSYRLASGSMAVPNLGNAVALTAALIAALGLIAWLVWRVRVPRLPRQAPSPLM